MKVLNLMVTGGTGGIETLCNNIDKSQKIDNYWCFLFDGGDIADEMIVRNSKKVYVLKYDKKKIIKRIKFVDEICKKNKIDIVAIHPGSIYGNIIYTILKKKNPSIKFVKFLHSCYDNKYYLKDSWLKNKINLYFLYKALEKSDLIISVSKAVEKSFEEKFNLENKNKTVIYNGIGMEFLNKEIKEKNNKNKEIIYVGRLETAKGVDILIRAISKLKDYNVHLTIVGDGNEKELERMVDELKIKDIVDFVGMQSNVIEFLDEAGIFVYPSVWQEAFGISVVEAMARGCIPVTFDKGGLPEIIINTENGFLVNEVSINKLYITIEEIINMNQNTRSLMVDNAKKTAKKFTINNTITELKKEYNRILNIDNN